MSQPALTKTKNLPRIKFSASETEWKPLVLGDVLNRTSRPVKVELQTEYREIGVRSHGKGIFHKQPISGKALGDKRVFWVTPNALVLNIVFAWEQAVAKTTAAEEGMIASHRFPMYTPLKDKLELDFIWYLFLTKRGKYLLELASPGGAGRNKTLGRTNFEELTILAPDLYEQRKITGVLNAVDSKLTLLTRKLRLLQSYKGGVLSSVFSREIRFTRENGNAYPDWQESAFGDIYTFLRTNSLSRAELSESGDIKCIHYGDIHTRLSTSFDSAKETLSYAESDKGSDYCAPGDLIIADASEDRADIGKSIELVNIHEEKIISGLHTLLARPKPNVVAIGFSGYLMQAQPLRRQLFRIATGATVLGISKTEMSKLTIPLPSLEEQRKIAEALTAIDDKISHTKKELEQVKKFKLGLLQQMFV